MEELIYNDNESLLNYTEDELAQAVLYVLNTFCNTQKYRGEILDVYYKLLKAELMYIDDPDEVDKPDYYFSGKFRKLSPQLKENESKIFFVEFWLSDYNTFGKMKELVMNWYDNPTLVRYRKDLNKKYKQKPEEVDNNNERIIDIGLDLDTTDVGDDFRIDDLNLG